MIQKTAIERLAEAGSHQVCREVFEFYSDYSARNSDLFSLSVSSIFVDSSEARDPEDSQRTTEGISVVLFVSRSWWDMNERPERREKR